MSKPKLVNFHHFLTRIFRSIHQTTHHYSANFTGTFRVKNCERVVIFGSPSTIFRSGSKFWLPWTVSQNVKISFFLSILPKSERVVPGTFSGYGKFPKRGSKFQSVNIWTSQYISLWIQTLSEKVQKSLQIIVNEKPQSHFLRRYDWIHRVWKVIKFHGSTYFNHLRITEAEASPCRSLPLKGHPCGFPPATPWLENPPWPCQ